MKTKIWIQERQPRKQEAHGHSRCVLLAFARLPGLLGLLLIAALASILTSCASVDATSAQYHRRFALSAQRSGGRADFASRTDAAA